MSNNNNFGGKRNIIAFDFDGVFHKSIYYEKNIYGQGHPKCKLDKLENCKPFIKIHELIKIKDKKGYLIDIVTHNPNIKGIKKFLKKNNMLKYINNIYSVDGNKGIKLKELNALEFYDDTNGVLEVVLQYCKEGNFCTKLFKVDPLKNTIKKYKSKFSKEQGELFYKYVKYRTLYKEMKQKLKKKYNIKEKEYD